MMDTPTPDPISLENFQGFLHGWSTALPWLYPKNQSSGRVVPAATQLLGIWSCFAAIFGNPPATMSKPHPNLHAPYKLENKQTWAINESKTWPILWNYCCPEAPWSTVCILGQYHLLGGDAMMVTFTQLSKISSQASLFTWPNAPRSEACRGVCCSFSLCTISIADLGCSWNDESCMRFGNHWLPLHRDWARYSHSHVPLPCLESRKFCEQSSV